MLYAYTIAMQVGKDLWSRSHRVTVDYAAPRPCTATVPRTPDLLSLTTSHIGRAFLTVRHELKRFQRKGLAYSKDLETHKLAVALHFSVYNFVRQHHTLGTTPAVAAGLEEKPWSFRTSRGNDLRLHP